MDNNQSKLMLNEAFFKLIVDNMAYLETWRVI